MYFLQYKPPGLMPFGRECEANTKHKGTSACNKQFFKSEGLRAFALFVINEELLNKGKK
jgi:hypothetical protein